MCGRYRLSRKKQIIEEYFGTDPWEQDWDPRYNIAPTQRVPIIRQHPSNQRRELSLAPWGLIPSWAKAPSIASSTINARSETAAIKPAFADALKFRGCLIPADGFYEWQRNGNARQPYCFEVHDRKLFAFAGIWDRWKDPTGKVRKVLETCSILTTTANSVTSAVHDRMPVILEPSSYGRWLNTGNKDVRAVSALFKPYDARFMRCYPISVRINQVDNDDKVCCRPNEPAEVQGHLF